MSDLGYHSDKRKISKMQKRDDKQVFRQFAVRQSRQFLAIAVTLLLMVFLALIYKRPEFFGELSKNTILAVEFVIFAAFIGFSAFNWRCPSCKKYLGGNINSRICKKCGSRLR